MSILKIVGFCFFIAHLITSVHLRAESNVNFSGVLIDVACQVNADQQVNVNFGDAVITHLVDGVHYEKPVPAEITCSNQYNGSLSFKINGTPTDFDTSALKTDVDGLGIKLKFNDIPLEIGKSYTITAESPMILKAVPVKKSGVELRGGKFSALGTMLVEPL